MKKLFAALIVLGLASAVFPLNAGTTAPPQLTITVPGKKPVSIGVFDKWTDGATIALGDLGADGINELVVGAGPGSKPDVRILREDGSLIKNVTVFADTFRGGVVVSVGDADNDGINDVIAAAGPGGGPQVRILDSMGTIKYDFFPFGNEYHGGVSASTVGGKLIASQLTGAAPISRSFTLANGQFVLDSEMPGQSITAQSTPTALTDEGATFAVPAPTFTNGKFDVPKLIEVNLSKQRMYAFENGYLAATFLVSTGNAKYPTPVGDYSAMKKIPLMDYRWSYGAGHPDNYFLPHVHWNTQFRPHMYIHEAYWHNAFGTIRSHGCINMRLNDAKFIYDWSAIGTPVIVHT